MIYERIKEECKKKKVSINKMESDLGIGKGSVCKMDIHKPSIEKIGKVANYLGVTADYLLTGSEEKPNDSTSRVIAAISADPQLCKMIEDYLSLSMDNKAFIAKAIDLFK